MAAIGLALGLVDGSTLRIEPCETRATTVAVW